MSIFGQINDARFLLGFLEIKNIIGDGFIFMDYVETDSVSALLTIEIIGFLFRLRIWYVLWIKNLLFIAFGATDGLFTVKENSWSILGEQKIYQLGRIMSRKTENKKVCQILTDGKKGL